MTDEQTIDRGGVALLRDVLGPKLDPEPRPPLIIYHFNCMDGLGALWAAKRALPEADVWSASYGQKPPVPSKLAGRDVVIVDFSYGLDDLRSMASVARSVLVLDHHDTAREALAELPTVPLEVSAWGGSSYNALRAGRLDLFPSNLMALFDMERSGAGLTWDYFHPGTTRPKIVNLIEDYDLWRFKYGRETRAFDAALRLNDLTQYETMLSYLGVLDTWSNSPDFDDAWATTIAEGNAVLKYIDLTVEGIIAVAERTIDLNVDTLDGVRCVKVPLVNVPPQFVDYTGNAMIKRHPEAPFVACYYDTRNGRRKFSLRAKPIADGGAHVGQIARRFGGGGHPGSAGFDRPLGWEGE